MSAEMALRLGAEFPYDTPDKWWDDAYASPPPASDWAHAAARGVLADLTDRKMLKHSLTHSRNRAEGLDEDVRVELVSSLAEIIRVAHANATTKLRPKSFP